MPNCLLCQHLMKYQKSNYRIGYGWVYYCGFNLMKRQKVKFLHKFQRKYCKNYVRKNVKSNTDFWTHGAIKE